MVKLFIPAALDSRIFNCCSFKLDHTCLYEQRVIFTDCIVLDSVQNIGVWFLSS